MYKGQIPFDQQDRPVAYPGGRASLVWKDNRPFTATLEFKRFERGRSAAHAIYAKQDDQRWEVTMFLSDLEDLINHGKPLSYLFGYFIFVKRGQNYGVRQLLRED